MKLRRRVATALDEVALRLGKFADRLDPPVAVRDRARTSVESGFAQGRADLQLVHGQRAPETLGELFADAVPPIPTERRGARFSVPEEWHP